MHVGAAKSQWPSARSILSICFHLFNSAELLLKPILFHLRAGQAGANTIFTNLEWPDSQLKKHVLQQRMGTTVLFQFHYDQRRHGGLCPATQVLEAQVAVDGETLSLVVVHQCETVENGS